MNHYDSFQIYLDEHIDSADTRIKLANWLKSIGDPRWEAWMWLGVSRKYPQVWRDGAATWWDEHAGPTHSRLTQKIIEVLQTLDAYGYVSGYRSRRDAEEAIVRHWSEITKLIQCPL